MRILGVGNTLIISELSMSTVVMHFSREAEGDNAAAGIIFLKEAEGEKEAVGINFLKEAEGENAAGGINFSKDVEGDNAAAFIDLCKSSAAFWAVTLAAATTVATFSKLIRAFPLNKEEAALCALITEIAALWFASLS